jgi:hypothetical protein
MSGPTMRQALLVAWLLLAAAAAYPQTLKTTVLADGSTIGLPPYWWVAAQNPGLIYFGPFDFARGRLYGPRRRPRVHHLGLDGRSA